MLFCSTTYLVDICVDILHRRRFSTGLLWVCQRGYSPTMRHPPTICAYCERPCKPGTEPIYVGADGIPRGLCSKRCAKKYNGEDEDYEPGE